MIKAIPTEKQFPSDARVHNNSKQTNTKKS